MRSPTSQVRTPLLLLAIVEFAILCTSVCVAKFLVYGTTISLNNFMGPTAWQAAVVIVTVMTCFAAVGLYQYHQRLYFSETAVRVVVGLAMASLVLAVLFYGIPYLSIGRTVALAMIVYALLLILAARFVFSRTVDEHIFRRRSVIYGAGKRAASIAAIRRRADRRGFKVVSQIAAVGDKFKDGTDAIDIGVQSISEIAIRENADEIVVAMDDRRGNLPIRDLLDARLNGVDVIDILEFLERETGKIQVDLVSPGWLIFSPGFRRSTVRQIAKRAVDILGSGLLFVVSIPVMIGVAIAIKIEDGLRAPIFYRQERVGRGDVPFNVLKFRSMTVDAEKDGKAVWATPGDARVTKVGNVLRNARLDELPQVFNVLGGQMSLVGPRPERPEFVCDLKKSIPYYSERHIVKPGVTGWAQLKYAYGASEEEAMEKLQYDLYYIKNQSLILDISIILQTVEVVLWGKGAR